MDTHTQHSVRQRVDVQTHRKCQNNTLIWQMFGLMEGRSSICVSYAFWVTQTHTQNAQKKEKESKTWYEREDDNTRVRAIRGRRVVAKLFQLAWLR